MLKRMFNPPTVKGVLTIDTRRKCKFLWLLVIPVSMLCISVASASAQDVLFVDDFASNGPLPAETWAVDVYPKDLPPPVREGGRLLSGGNTTTIQTVQKFSVPISVTFEGVELGTPALQELPTTSALCPATVPTCSHLALECK